MNLPIYELHDCLEVVVFSLVLLIVLINYLINYMF